VQQVTVYGQQQQLDGMDFYEGPSIDLSGLKENKTLLLDIPLMNKITKVEPSQVEVQVEIVPSATKTLEGVPVSIVGQNEQFETQIVDPEAGAIRLDLEGAPALLDGVRLQDVHAFIDVSNLPPGRHELKVNVNLPPFIKMAGAKELKATVEIRAKPGQQQGQQQPGQQQQGQQRQGQS
jgi:YbbR domain-containing protein